MRPPRPKRRNRQRGARGAELAGELAWYANPARPPLSGLHRPEEGGGFFPPRSPGLQDEIVVARLRLDPESLRAAQRGEQPPSLSGSHYFVAACHEDGDRPLVRVEVVTGRPPVAQEEARQERVMVVRDIDKAGERRHQQHATDDLRPEARGTSGYAAAQALADEPEWFGTFAGERIHRLDRGRRDRPLRGRARQRPIPGIFEERHRDPAPGESRGVVVSVERSPCVPVKDQGARTRPGLRAGPPAPERSVSGTPRLKS